MAIPQAVEKWLDEKEQEALSQKQKAEETLEAIRKLRSADASHEPPKPSSSTDDIILGAIEILKQYGMPLLRETILEELEALDIHVGGKKPVNNLGAILSRTKDFVSHGGGVWGLKIFDQPKPTTNIDTGDSDPTQKSTTGPPQSAWHAQNGLH